jgi:hypothetical protein
MKDKSECPKPERWFEEGGQCGWAHECKNCSNNPFKAKEEGAKMTDKEELLTLCPVCRRLVLESELKEQIMCLNCRQHEAKIERLAEYAHRAWSSWMEYLFSKRIPYAPDGFQAETDALVIPKEEVERWTRQMMTAYKSLSEKERWLDRQEANKIIRVIGYGGGEEKLSDEANKYERVMESVAGLLFHTLEVEEDPDPPVYTVAADDIIQLRDAYQEAAGWEKEDENA